MPKENLGFHPLAQHMPDKVSKYADQDIYVKEDDLGENFDILRDLLYQNFATMKSNGIELKITRDRTKEEWEKDIQKMKKNGLSDIHIPKPPYPKIPINIKCKSKGDMNNAYAYYLTFQNGDRITFTKSGIAASNEVCITSKNARNLYADTEFQTQLTSAIQTGKPQPLLNLLSQYSRQDRSVNNAHTKQNLYRKTDKNTYTPVGQNYSMENFYQNAVDNYNHRPEAIPFEIRDCKNPSQTGRFYNEYEYDPVNICVRNPYIVGRAQVYKDMHEREQRNRFNQLREYYPKLWNYEINFRRPLYFIDYGSYLVPVYQSL